MKKLFSCSLLFALTFFLGWVSTPLIAQVSRAHGGPGDMMPESAKLKDPSDESTIVLSPVRITQGRNDKDLSEWIFAAKASGKASAHEGPETEKPTSVEEPNSTIWREIKEGFSFTFRTLGYGRAIEPDDH